MKKDFGEVSEGESLKHVFRFTNKGQALLEIQKVEAACGCTAAVLSSKQIAPGGAGEIEVSLKTEGLTSVSKTINIASNDPKQPEVTLTITANVHPEFQLSERSIYFGSVPRGKEVTKEFVITVPPDKNRQLLGATSTDQYVAAKLEAVGGSNGRKYRVTAVQKADAKDGYHFGVIVIKTTSPVTPELKIPVRGMVTPPAN
jgi:hypothetical protein